MATHQIAQGIAKLGRHGDSTLMHVTPHEVAGLQALARANGTSLTINPHTGLPEAFSLGGFFKSMLPTIAGFAAAGMSGGAMSPMMAGILAGAGTGALTSKDPLTGALMGGLGGYGGSQLFSAANAFTPAANAGAGATEGIKQAASQTGTTFEQAMLDPTVKQQIQNQSVAMMTPYSSAVGPNMGATNMNYAGLGSEIGARNLGAALPANVATTAPTANSMLGATGAFENSVGRAGMGVMGGSPEAAVAQAANPSMFAGSTDNITNAVGNVAADPMGFLGQKGNLMKVGMPIGGALLGGLEPTDLYGNPIRPGQNPNEKYDPYKTLNLSGSTGLKLYAHGGPVSFADGGNSNKEEQQLSLDPANLPGGGAEAMQGAGQFEVTPGGTKLGLFATPEQIDAARKADELAMAAQGRGLPGLGIGTGLDRNNPTMATMGQFGRMNGGMGSTAPTMATMGSLGRTAQTAQTAAPKYNYLEQLNLNSKQYADGGTIQSGGIQDLYGTSDNVTGPALSRDGYGLGRLNAMSQGGVMGYAKGGYLDGPGDGMSDSIPATIEGKQPARLADGEFVIPADVVSHLGNGSTKAGSQRLYGMLDKVRKARTGTKKQGKQINPAKYMPA